MLLNFTEVSRLETGVDFYGEDSDFGMFDVIKDGSVFCSIRFYDEDNNPIADVPGFRLSNVKIGKFKNPFVPEVFGAGYYGINKSSGMTKEVKTVWKKLVRQSCSKEYTKHKYSICDEWLNGSNFTQWWIVESAKFARNSDIVFHIKEGETEYNSENCYLEEIKHEMELEL